MTARTAASIYFNPDDVEIIVAELKDNSGKWGLGITRGPRHLFQVLITSENAEFDSKEEVITTVEKLLKQCKEYGEKVFTDPELSLLKALCTRGWNTKDEYTKNSAPVLEDKDIERIVTELQKKEISSSYKWNGWKKRYPKGVLS